MIIMWDWTYLLSKEIGCYLNNNGRTNMGRQKLSPTILQTQTYFLCKLPYQLEDLNTRRNCWPNPITFLHVIWICLMSILLIRCNGREGTFEPASCLHQYPCFAIGQFLFPSLYPSGWLWLMVDVMDVVLDHVWPQLDAHHPNKQAWSL